MWSKIQHTSLAKVARDKIETNARSGCAYHNMDHVWSMYAYIESVGEPYDEALDWAVLFHDAVYDNGPHKEVRSAVLFDRLVKSVPDPYIDPGTIVRAHAMIMDTTSHVVLTPASSAIVRADLHGLANPIQTIKNFVNILEESCTLYSIGPDTFASKNLEFMEGLSSRVSQNIETDSDHAEFYKSVLKGISLTRRLSTTLLGATK